MPALADLIALCAAHELPMPGSECMSFRIRREHGRIVADVGRGGRTRTLGAYDSEHDASKAIDAAITDAKAWLADQWDRQFAERGDLTDRQREKMARDLRVMRDLLGALPWVREPEPPVGLLEIADRLGVEVQTARNWRTRGVLPEPQWTVSGAPAWDWSTIENWARDTGRLTD